MKSILLLKRIFRNENKKYIHGARPREIFGRMREVYYARNSLSPDLEMAPYVQFLPALKGKGENLEIYSFLKLLS